MPLVPCKAGQMSPHSVGLGHMRFSFRVKSGLSQLCPECRKLGYKRKSISGGWMSACSQKRTLDTVLSDNKNRQILDPVVVNCGAPQIWHDVRVSLPIYLRFGSGTGRPTLSQASTMSGESLLRTRGRLSCTSSQGIWLSMPKCQVGAIFSG